MRATSPLQSYPLDLITVSVLDVWSESPIGISGKWIGRQTDT